MYAIIETGSKQYIVNEGDKIKIEKLDIEEGKDFEFDKVLYVSGDSPKVGKPYLENTTVKAKVLKHGKNKKVIIYKYKPKKNERKKKGHRQPYTLVEITAI